VAAMGGKKNLNLGYQGAPLGLMKGPGHFLTVLRAPLELSTSLSVRSAGSPCGWILLVRRLLRPRFAKSLVAALVLYQRIRELRNSLGLRSTCHPALLRRSAPYS